MAKKEILEVRQGFNFSFVVDGQSYGFGVAARSRVQAINRLARHLKHC